jgi:nucleotide-binding universal stress UspA family protein/osmotically-inducible protein OsmY
MLRDAKLQADVEQELRREPSIRAGNIGVAAKNGVVELDGHVDSLYEKSAAEHAAMRVANVRAVASEIKVVLPLSAVRTDEDIAQNALNHLEWDFLSVRNIKVKVTDGWVTLLGSVEWQFQKEEAERVVRHLKGVKGVTNEIEIQPKISVGDLKEVLPTSAPDPLMPVQKSAQAATVEDELTYKKILVPIDFSGHSRKTVSYAARFASRYDATLQVLHVFEIPDYAVAQYGYRQQNCDQFKSQVDAAEQEARDNLTAFEKQLLDRGIKVEAYLRVGCPFDEIVHMANHLGVDLIIIGSHGLTGLKHLLLGSTAERVVQHARCPVLVVKEP